MPIKPENKHLYPPRKEWLAIRAEVLAREGNACKKCRLDNGAIGFRNEEGKFVELPDGTVFDPRVEGWLRIVLTIAHLDHNPRNNGRPGDRPNLAALCQQCHLRHDAKHHARNARVTRDRARGQENLL